MLGHLPWIIAGCVVTVVSAILWGGYLWQRDRTGSNLDLLPLLWSEGRYDELSKECMTILESTPISYLPLVYGGFSDYYLAINEVSPDLRLPLADRAIQHLRKTQLLELTSLQGEIEYILGKVYTLKGRYYYDLAIRYLERSIASGYLGDDTYDSLGFLHRQIGAVSSSVEFYKLGLEHNPSSLTRLSLAQSYSVLDQHEKAIEQLMIGIESPAGVDVKEKMEILLGRLYSEMGEYSSAVSWFNTALNTNQDSADAYYYLGSLYEQLGDTVKARYNWRRALEINPYHYATRRSMN